MQSLGLWVIEAAAATTKINNNYYYYYYHCFIDISIIPIIIIIIAFASIITFASNPSINFMCRNLQDHTVTDWIMSL